MKCVSLCTTITIGYKKQNMLNMTWYANMEYQFIYMVIVEKRNVANVTHILRYYYKRNTIEKILSVHLLYSFAFNISEK